MKGSFKCTYSVTMIEKFFTGLNFCLEPIVSNSVISFIVVKRMLENKHIYNSPKRNVIHRALTNLISVKWATRQ
jgi:hypothetical protein